jgi:hypothetical protein
MNGMTENGNDYGGTDLRRTEGATGALKTQQSRKAGDLTLKVSEKGAVSVYGLGRFPVTLYQEQWLKLLDRGDEIRAFIAQNADKLKKKE